MNNNNNGNDTSDKNAARKQLLTDILNLADQLPAEKLRVVRAFIYGILKK